MSEIQISDKKTINITVTLEDAIAMVYLIAGKLNLALK
jgi:hypothetical protein